MWWNKTEGILCKFSEGGDFNGTSARIWGPSEPGVNGVDGRTPYFFRWLTLSQSWGINYAHHTATPPLDIQIFLRPFVIWGTQEVDAFNNNGLLLCWRSIILNFVKWSDFTEKNPHDHDFLTTLAAPFFIVGKLLRFIFSESVLCVGLGFTRKFLEKLK